MRLFAERGYGATSVADIEKAVGLQPRRGGLYKHFTNKHDLLESAVRASLDNAASVARQLDSLELGVTAGHPSGVRSLVMGLGRWFLEEMDRLEELTRVLEHDASRMFELTAAVKADMVDLSYGAAARAIASFAPGVRDVDALAIVVLGSLVALRRTAWTFGAPPLGIGDDRFLKTWADATLAALENAVVA
jgi:AcrR family transcriptional regulator